MTKRRKKRPKVNRVPQSKNPPKNLSHITFPTSDGLGDLVILIAEEINRELY